MSKRKEIIIECPALIVARELFMVLRANGIEPSIPMHIEDSYFMVVNPSSSVDKILISWKDFVKYRICEVNNAKW